MNVNDCKDYRNKHSLIERIKKMVEIIIKNINKLFKKQERAEISEFSSDKNPIYSNEQVIKKLEWAIDVMKNKKTKSAATYICGRLENGLSIYFNFNVMRKKS